MADKRDASADHNLFAEERRRRILEMLAAENRVLVNDLSERFGVSSATLRNDLRDLEAAGLLRRTHGGAVALETVAVEHTADAALTEHRDAKAAIGAKAAGLVHDGDTIVIDSGSSTFEMVHALKMRHRLTIITNDFSIAAEIERLLPPDNETIMLGGEVRRGFHYTMGSHTIASIEKLSAPVAFMATNAFSFERGFSVHTTDLAIYKEKLIERSEKQVMLIDSSKFGTFTMVSFAELGDVSTIITDKGIDPRVRERIETTPGAPGLVVA